MCLTKELQAISCFRQSFSHLHLTILQLVSSLGACRRAIRVLNYFSNIFQEVSTCYYYSIKTCCYQKYFKQDLQTNSCFCQSLFPPASHDIVSGKLVWNIYEGDLFTKFFLEHFSEREYLSLPFHKNMLLPNMFDTRIIANFMFQTFLLSLASHHIVAGKLIRVMQKGNPCTKFFFEHFSENEYL